MSSIILSAENLTLAYADHKIIDGVSFKIHDGDFVCMVGANGSGKSTLIKGILGLKKPISGRVIFGDGVSRTSIGYLPQESHLDQKFPATVLEIVLSGALGRLGFWPCYRPVHKATAQEIIKNLGIADLQKDSFSDLSGGQKQKVLLARALVATKKLLILDEPSNNLDYKSKQDFYQTLKNLNRHKRLTIIMITHDLDAEDLIGNKILAIEKGQIRMCSTKEYLRSYR